MGGRLVDQSLGGGAFNGNVALDLDWQLVRQPVPWQEAIQAWYEGKKVVWEDDTDRRVFREKRWLGAKHQSYLIDEEGEALTIGEIFLGKWYVED